MLFIATYYAAFILFAGFGLAWLGPLAHADEDHASGELSPQPISVRYGQREARGRSPFK